MHLLVTGGCGYVGTPLTHALLADGHRVTVVDTQWFGNFLTPHPNLTVIKDDIRNTRALPYAGVDAILHLANIANDPSVDLQPTLSWEVNVLAAQQMAECAIAAGVKQFIFASSGSVYGVKDEPHVTEDLPLEPISVYNKTKMVAERVLLSYADKMHVHCIRPATVCGLSPRMRLDVAVNMLTMQALKNHHITVLGGAQTRPNIHMKDMVRVYQHFLAKPSLPSGCYNAGFENISILDIAERIAAVMPATIEVKDSNDPRSYRQDSSKLRNTGFSPNFTVADAITDIRTAYQAGALRDEDGCYNIRQMKQLNVA